MNKLQGEVLTLPKMSGFVSTLKSLSGNVGAKTINIGGKGDDGATFIPSVSADGVISWTNDKELPNPEPVNIKGAKGDKGDKGDRGLQGVQGIQGERGEQGQKSKVYKARREKPAHKVKKAQTESLRPIVGVALRFISHLPAVHLPQT